MDQVATKPKDALVELQVKLMALYDVNIIVFILFLKRL